MDAALKALTELVRLKDIKDKMDLGTASVEEHQDYASSKEAAWRVARAVVVAA